MEILISLILFFIGIVLVVKGGDAFVDSASWIAKALNVPTFIIGATIVSVATTLPELIVSVTAAAEGKIDMAIGNAVGSVTANTAMIMAIAMVAMHIACSRKKYLIQMLLLIASSTTLYVSSLSGDLNIIGSICLAVIFVLFIIQNIRSAKNEIGENNTKEKIEKNLLVKNIVIFVVGALAIVIGSRLMVDNGSKIAASLGVPERVIAVTLLAVGTSLPELITTITAILKRESGLSIGNVIGANIIDLTLILPVCSLVAGKPLPVAAQSIAIDLPACLIVTLIAMVPLILREKASKLQGILMLCCYVVYMGITIF